MRRIIKEELGMTKFNTGALTPQGHGLILFAKDNLETFEFSLENKDKAAIFDKAIEQYEKRFGETVKGDRETVFYDFMAHYQRPGTITAAEWMFGPLLGNEVIFDQSLGNTKFTVKVDTELVTTVQQMADKAGYVANMDGSYDRNASQVTMRLIKRTY